MFDDRMNKNKISYGKCRFCYAKGNHKDIMEEYDWNGIREMYYGIFQECFNIYLTINSDRSSLICTSCVSKLREASSFRMMVISSEQQFHDALDNKETVFINVSNELEDENDGQVTDFKIEIDGDTDNEYYCEDLSGERSLDDVYGEAELLSRFQPDTIKPLPTRRKDAYIACKEFVKQLDLLKGKHITAKCLEKFVETECSKKVLLTEKLAHVHNITTLLENSNLAAFKTKRRSGLPCFYCMTLCANFDDLLQHQSINNCKGNVRRILTRCRLECLVVYVYVKDLKCIICEQNLNNINELKMHLERVHQKNFHSGYGDRIIPYSFSRNQYECQVCKFNFETFGSIERHMKVHFRNFVCDQCGAGYITRNRLKVHLRHTHVTGVFPCETCNKTFATRRKYRLHVDLVHKSMKKNKCPKCPERFADYFRRDRHMAEVHGDSPLRYKCNICDAVFKRRYALTSHINRCHLEVRNIQCTVCPYKCYSSTDLKVHMVRHNGEKTFECTVCKKSYARKKTLKDHIKIHTNDRRFACVVCGQKYVQNSNLKAHMRALHQDMK